MTTYSGICYLPQREDLGYWSRLPELLDHLTRGSIKASLTNDYVYVSECILFLTCDEGCILRLVTRTTSLRLPMDIMWHCFRNI